jgi:peptidoglycan-associated lipoprotein
MRGMVIFSIVSLLAFSYTGCVTKKVFDQEMQARDERITSLESELEMNETRIDKHEKILADLSVSTQEALTRAEEAGELAKGKFLYEMILSDDRCKFSMNQIVLEMECQVVLDEFVERIKQENKNIYIEIQGHTDNSGTEELNYLIGRKRAEAVYNYLGMHGLPLNRMNVISYGESLPVADNATIEGRQINRRVVLVVLE